MPTLNLNKLLFWVLLENLNRLTDQIPRLISQCSIACCVYSYCFIAIEHTVFAPKLKKSNIFVGRPSATMVEDYVEVQETQKIRLTCQISGEPKPVVHWLKDGTALNLSNRVRLRTSRWAHKSIIMMWISFSFAQVFTIMWFLLLMTLYFQYKKLKAVSVDCYLRLCN